MLQIKDKKLSSLTKQLNRVMKENETLKYEAQRHKEFYEKTLNDIKTEQQESASLISKILTEPQISRLKYNGRKKHWSKQDMISTIEIYSISRKAYRYVRKKMKIPLPSPTSVQRWMRSVPVDEGFLESSFKLLSCENININEGDKGKIVILSFDEMSLKNEYCYDSTHDKVYFPPKKSQVIFVRGLFNKFKVPIFVGFDQRMTDSILFQAIAKTEEEGFIVKAIVCDQAPENVKLISELGINENKTFFHCPSNPDEKIFAFFDVPHALKNVRNHILDNGLKLPSGNVLNKHIFMNLLKKDAEEYKICHKLTYAHINVS
jgi:hypothetical protein